MLIDIKFTHCFFFVSLIATSFSFFTISLISSTNLPFSDSHDDFISKHVSPVKYENIFFLLLMIYKQFLILKHLWSCTTLAYIVYKFIGKLNIFLLMCAPDNVWITELTWIHKNIRSFITRISVNLMQF